MDTRLILTTLPTQEKSVEIARTLVEAHLVACVTILPGVLSIYWWQEKVQEDQECLLIIKTSRYSLEKTISEIKRLHPYDTPEIVVIDPDLIDEKYQKWLLDATSAACASKEGHRP